jgi:hypothetical protein
MNAELARSFSVPKRSKKKASGEHGHASLLAAFAAAQHDASQVSKRGKNEEGNDGRGYAYALAEDIIIEAKAILRRHGLAVLPISTELRESKIAVGGVELVSHFVLLHASSGQERDLGERVWPVIAGPDQTLDRAHASADTSLLAYFLRNLLQMPRVEDGADADEGKRDLLLQHAGVFPPPSSGSGSGSGARRAGGSGSGARTVDNLQRLTKAVDAEMERLNIADEERERKARRVLGREPQTMVDLKELIKKLRRLGREQ